MRLYHVAQTLEALVLCASAVHKWAANMSALVEQMCGTSCSSSRTPQSHCAPPAARRNDVIGHLQGCTSTFEASAAWWCMCSLWTVCSNARMAPQAHAKPICIMSCKTCATHSLMPCNQCQV